MIKIFRTTEEFDANVQVESQKRKRLHYQIYRAQSFSTYYQTMKIDLYLQNLELKLTLQHLNMKKK